MLTTRYEKGREFLRYYQDAAIRAAIEQLARANPNVQRFVAGQNVKKVVVVPGRLVNLVV